MEALHLVLKFKLLASKSFFRIMFNFFFFVTLVILEGHLEIKWFINAFSDMELSSQNSGECKGHVQIGTCLLSHRKMQ